MARRALEPVDPNPSWNGYSSAAWEGDTLVVQTNGFRDGLARDMGGNPLTDAAKMTERIRRPNYGTLEVSITIDDPKAYTRPWTVEMNQAIRLDTELIGPDVPREREVVATDAGKVSCR